MPWRDGTGPFGTGPVGRRMGPCGYSRSYGFGPGRGWRRGWYWQNPVQTVAPEEERKILENQKEFLLRELEEIKRQIKEIEERLKE